MNIISYSFVPLPTKKRGRRARRQSFYRRQRIARVLQRFVRIESAKWQASIEQAHRDMLITGTGWVETLWDRGDGEGFTARPIEPGEWPKAMLRTWSIEP